jgi:hypothetical protein
VSSTARRRQEARAVHPVLLAVLGNRHATLPRDQDWPELIADARSHAVVPLLYAWLREMAEGCGSK